MIYFLKGQVLIKSNLFWTLPENSKVLVLTIAETFFSRCHGVSQLLNLLSGQPQDMLKLCFFSGKQQRDRRKLREKRRSTGVVHLARSEHSLIFFSFC